ncbi:hypothetical protein I3843_11G080600 [Carya illinoinensis]|uniref:Uncharacterized protein n=1 Tax=Carya illinoinensis TaxID=32201 RepID=A0A922DN43_CARIL|nr:uncharacterized protein LOC122282849 isoform X2 [Carya illinoinensis]KAG2680061.1 hypothetical protein I3760_11G080600 [Carya illinoinensis]KAG6687613.1 hypothetical protein I3842_11G081100 [Carya illinoinensis]KAG7955597.1 hypothetical protein I3843_11G080600 [Carya illinoinensis]
MEKNGEVEEGPSSTLPIGTRHSDLKKSFKLALRSLLTACSNQEFCNAFPRFTAAEQQPLHRLFIQVGATLDSVEQLVEEQSLDSLFLNKTNVMDVAGNLSIEKKNEIQLLTGMLDMAEKRNSLIRARVEHLRQGMQDVSGMADALEKLRSRSLSYACNSNAIHDP